MKNVLKVKTSGEAFLSSYIIPSRSLVMPQKGFTLAETLLTLGIIGIVAAMTLPSVINATENIVLKRAWKKEYISISQAFEFIKDENG